MTTSFRISGHRAASSESLPQRRSVSGFVDQQGVVDRQPQREGEADALDRQIHPEGAGCIIDRPAPDQVLDRGDVEQRGDQQQHDKQDK